MTVHKDEETKYYDAAGNLLASNSSLAKRQRAQQNRRPVMPELTEPEEEPEES